MEHGSSLHDLSPSSDNNDDKNNNDKERKIGSNSKSSSRRYTPDLGPVSQFTMPKELLPYIDLFLQTPKAKEWGVKDYRDFIILIMTVQLAQIEKAYAKLAKLESLGDKGHPVLVPNETLRLYDDLLDGLPAISKVGWFPFKNSLVAHSIRDILAEFVPGYRDVVNSIKAGPSEVEEYVEERRRAKVGRMLKEGRGENQGRGEQSRNAHKDSPSENDSAA